MAEWRAWKRSATGNICGQPLVERGLNGVCGASFQRAQMRDLRERMDSSVGAPRSAQVDFFAKVIFRRNAQRTLHRAALFLLLPAQVPRTFVLDRQFPGRHRRTV
jgi:hypothetical protein